jgi:hypothetical protein
MPSASPQHQRSTVGLPDLMPRDLPLAVDARDHLIDIANDTERKQDHGQPFADITGTASKAAKQAARIAGVLAMFRDLHSPCIALEDAANAVESMGCCLSEALRLSRAATLFGDLECAEKLRAGSSTHGPTTELRQAPKVRAAIATLAKYGWLTPFLSGEFIRGAARRKAWRIVRE